MNKELENLWKERIGLFAKVRVKTNDGDVLLFGVVKTVVENKVVLANVKNPTHQVDIFLKDILSADLSPVKQNDM